MDYKEEMRKFKIKRFIGDLLSLIFIVSIFGVGLYFALKYQPAKYTHEERLQQLNHWRER